MENSTLSLKIDKGSQKGEIHVIIPGKIIRIGRVVKGNTLSIRDPGISQKHLTIYFCIKINHWVVTDLGSSNGTYLNRSLILPKKPYSLSDGDIIKLGEETSISVNIYAPVAKPIALSRPWRNCRPPKTVTFEDELQEKLEEPGGKRLRGRLRESKGIKSIKILRKGDAIDTVGVNMFKEEEEDVMILSKIDFESLAGKVQQLNENNTGPEEEAVMLSKLDSENVAGNEKQLNENNTGPEEEVVVLSKLDSENVAGNEKQLKENNSGAEEEVVTGVEENKSKAEEMVFDINNMTLEEWFDRMEEYLPRAINKVAEEKIAKIREKAQLYEEFLAQTSDVQGE